MLAPWSRTVYELQVAGKQTSIPLQVNKEVFLGRNQLSMVDDPAISRAHVMVMLCDDSRVNVFNLVRSHSHPQLYFSHSPPQQSDYKIEFRSRQDTPPEFLSAKKSTTLSSGSTITLIGQNASRYSFIYKKRDYTQREMRDIMQQCYANLQVIQEELKALDAMSQVGTKRFDLNRELDLHSSKQPRSHDPVPSDHYLAVLVRVKEPTTLRILWRTNEDNGELTEVGMDKHCHNLQLYTYHGAVKGAQSLELGQQSAGGLLWKSTFRSFKVHRIHHCHFAYESQVDYQVDHMKDLFHLYGWVQGLPVDIAWAVSLCKQLRSILRKEEKSSTLVMEYVNLFFEYQTLHYKENQNEWNFSLFLCMLSNLLSSFDSKYPVPLWDIHHSLYLDLLKYLAEETPESLPASLFKRNMDAPNDKSALERILFQLSPQQWKQSFTHTPENSQEFKILKEIISVYSEKSHSSCAECVQRKEFLIPKEFPLRKELSNLLSIPRDD